MKRIKKKLSISLIVFLLYFVFSCKSKNDILYMKNIEQIALQTSLETSKFTIQPGDQLIITVTAKDNEVVKPFNQNYFSNDMSQYTLPNNNLAIQGQTTLTGPTYIINSKGELEFPILGSINTAGKTIEELRGILIDKLKVYIKNPGVNLRNTNFKVTVLGEVNKSGTFLIPDGQSMTILGVLGMAGDLTIYGQRKDILLVRNIDGVMTSKHIDITDAEFINSPYYYSKQNDVIYVSPNNSKKNSSAFGPQTGIYISVASVLVGLLALIFR